MSKIRTVLLGKLPACDVCKLEFASSEPNEAHYDGPINGIWGYMCEDHKRIIPGLTVKLVKRS